MIELLHNEISFLGRQFDMPDLKHQFYFGFIFCF